MTIHKSWLAFLLLQLFGFSTYAAQQTDCTNLEFATFIAAAQSLDQSADSKGRRMMTCSRRDYRESAMYWLSFFHGMMERKTSLASISPLIAAESVGPGEKEFAIREALLGRVQVLSSRVASQTLGYADDPYVLLTLARTSMMTENFRGGQDAYASLLSMQTQAEQDSAEIELLFASIWAKDLEAARAKIFALQRYSLSPYMRQSILRANALVAEQKILEESHDELSLAFIQRQDNRGYASTGGRLKYEGLVELEMEGLQEESELESEKTKALSLNVGKVWGDEDNSFLETRLGYFSHNPDSYTGRFALGFRVTEHAKLEAHVERREVAAYERPPVGDRAGLMRETVGYQLDLYERAEFRADIFREETDSLVQNFVGQVKIGNLLKDKTSGFGLVVPFSYRKRPVASPDYPSYPNDLRLGLGFRLALSDGYAYMLRAQMSLDSIYRDDYGSLDSYENSIGARLVTEGRYYFLKSYYNYFEASAFAISKRRHERREERGSSLLLGLGFSQ